jgi:hypothetical protein
MKRVSLSVVATTGLVGALVTAGLPAAQASTHVARAPAGTCAAFAKHHFVEALSAKNDGSLTRVTAHPAKFICGGPDDGHYRVNEHKVVTLTLHPGAKVEVLRSASRPSRHSLARTRLPHRLRHDHSERIFKVTGHRSDVTRLVEEFHP